MLDNKMTLLEGEEVDSFKESNEILDMIYALSHIRDEEGENVPQYCFTHEITDIYGMSNEEVIKLAKENGYKIIKVFANEDIDGDYIIADPKCSNDLIKKDYEKFFGVEVELEEVSGISQGPKVDTKKSQVESLKEAKETRHSYSSVDEMFKSILGE